MYKKIIINKLVKCGCIFADLVINLKKITKMAKERTGKVMPVQIKRLIERLKSTRIELKNAEHCADIDLRIYLFWADTDIENAIKCITRFYELERLKEFSKEHPEQYE